MIYIYTYIYLWYYAVLSQLISNSRTVWSKYQIEPHRWQNALVLDRTGDYKEINSFWMTTPTTVNLLQRSLCREMFEKWREGDMFFGEKVSQYPLNQSMQHMDKWQLNAAQQKLFVCLHLSVFYSVESVGSMGTMRSIRSQRVRHNWMTFTFIQYTILCIIIYSFFFFARILERSDFKVSIKNGNIAIGNIAAHLFWVSLFACWTPLLFSH